MKGFSKHLNTKNDYLNIKKDFQFSEYKSAFQELLDQKDAWMNMGVISEGDGVIDDTHKVIENEVAGESTVKYQYEYKEDSEAAIFRLGFSTNEVREILAGE